MLHEYGASSPTLRKRAPAIIFIDEIDAIGGRRGPGGFGSNDEREQTLNQLLSEMDGFEPDVSIVVMGATNRAEILDSALLRPGRFDRTVEIPLPNQKERTAILAIHGQGKQLGPDVDLDAVSRGTPGFSGADLANLVNEAAINAVRGNRHIIRAIDFASARDRLLIGRRDASNALLPEEKHSVAVHEAGHALVAILSEHADPVAKVTILPVWSGARCYRTAARIRAPPVPEELSHRLSRRPSRRPGRGDHRPRRTLDRCVQRPRRGYRSCDSHGAGMGILDRGGTDRIWT